MSSLWTPGGEHEVPPRAPDSPDTAPSDDEMADLDAALASDPRFADMDPETAREMAARMAEAQQQILATPVDQLVSNHVMGLYELAALHLSTDPPDLASARLPIDAMGLLIDQLGNRLAEAETLTGALGQIRMAYVSVANDSDGDEGDTVADDD